VARVERVGGDEGAVSVAYSTINGSATGGSDCTPANGTLQWQDGAAGVKTFNVAILDDAADESDETLTLELFVKMSDSACALAAGNPLRNYWVFLAGLTDVEARVTIVDTEADLVKTYLNPLQTKFQTVLATTAAAGAFATCAP
jgi:hypothetical protein